MNPYETPKSTIQDQHQEPLIIQKTTYLLLGLWVITFLIEIPYFIYEIDLSFLELYELGFIFSLVIFITIAPYFFLLYLPVKKLKKTAWRWWLMTGWFFLGLYLWFDMTDESLLDSPSFAAWLSFISGYLEVLVIFAGAYWLKRPASLDQLTQ